MKNINDLLLAMDAMQIIELFAVFIGFTYLILIALKIRWGWVFAFFSSAIYVYLAYSVQLYLESALQAFYVFMALYGWVTWNKARNDSASFLRRWPIKYHLVNLALSCLLSLVLGYVLASFTTSESPYLNSFTTVFSLVTTYLATQRIVENWLYWIVIDSALIFLYAGQGLYFIGFQYFVYTFIAILAFLSWYKSYKNQLI